MTTQEKIEAVRQACIVSNPEIVELKFGCQINDNLIYLGLGYSLDFPQDENHTLKIITPEKGDYKNSQLTIKLYPLWRYGHDKDCDGECGVKDSWDFCQRYHKIVGRPIRLADVLLAISGRTGYNGKCWMLEQDGLYVFERLKRIAWNLRNDDLTQQSEETISFLYELLK